MDRFATKVEAGVLVVDTGTLEAGPDRGAKKYFSPPQGPSCVEGA